MNTTLTPEPARNPSRSSTSAGMPRIRPQVQALPRYVPGRTQAGAIKLSSNENPYPPEELIIQEAVNATALVNRYPDLTAAPVRAAISADLGIAPEQICVGAGSSAVLLAALMAVSDTASEVIFPWRSFESYPIAVPAAGATPVPVPLTATWEHDLPAMTAAITPQTAAIIVCTPNNPTGTALTLQQIAELLAGVPAHILVLVDEAYIEFSTQPEISTALPLLDQYPNLLILRTFSKAYGLAGMRVGYGVGHPDLIAAVQAVSIPFGVAGPAQSAAVAALQEKERVLATVRTITAERSRMRQELRALGWDVPSSQANFLWLPEAPHALFAHCRDADILVRPFPEGIRLTVGTPEENDAALAAIASFSGPPSRPSGS